MIRKALVLASAASLAISPAVAQASMAISAANAAEVERAGAEPGQQQMMSSWFVPGLVLIAAIVAAFLLLDGGDEEPASP